MPQDSNGFYEFIRGRSAFQSACLDDCKAELNRDGGTVQVILHNPNSPCANAINCDQLTGLASEFFGGGTFRVEIVPPRGNPHAETQPRELLEQHVTCSASARSGTI